jgi:leader peptidase (prepilin peptidase)/N-methyltransferase
MLTPQLPTWFAYLAVALFGACVGSFLNVCIYRLPLGRSIVTPRSHCPRCRKPIHWYDNVPLLSYVVLQGKCRHCGAHISPRYIIVEALTVGLSLATYGHFGALPQFLIYFCFLVAPLIVVTFIDLEHRLIPDVISLPGIIAGAMARLAFNTGGNWTPVVIDIILGILVGGGFLSLVGLGYEWLKKQEGLGGGDVKLAAMLGAFFGWKAVIFILLVSSMLGSIVGLVLIFIFRKGLKYAMPFGPFIVAAAYVYLFFGERILNWYLGLF